MFWPAKALLCSFVSHAKSVCSDTQFGNGNWVFRGKQLLQAAFVCSFEIFIAEHLQAWSVGSVYLSVISAPLTVALTQAHLFPIKTYIHLTKQGRKEALKSIKNVPQHLHTLRLCSLKALTRAISFVKNVDNFFFLAKKKKEKEGVT